MNRFPESEMKLRQEIIVNHIIAQNGDNLEALFALLDEQYSWQKIFVETEYVLSATVEQLVKMLSVIRQKFRGNQRSIAPALEQIAVQKIDVRDPKTFEVDFLLQVVRRYGINDCRDLWNAAESKLAELIQATSTVSV